MHRFPYQKHTLASPAHLEQLLLYLDRAEIVGLDTEFSSSAGYRPRLELIQDKVL